ncbi:hypothetical protein OE88DRAFT_980018 [Heliocybe sulcata]|uniref:Uncharacterized protein n=1 Tax=Heliocybe sulcata TaxID=5364 RepID=A0A5C3NCB1_9AGAM|nr:hypothetical protein OE88DRAFT_980018 [Heliocybe sulcata]
MTSIQPQDNDYTPHSSQQHLPSSVPRQPSDSSQVPDSLEPLSGDYPPAHGREDSEAMQSPNLPELPKHELEFSFDSILRDGNSEFAAGPEVERVQKRASNVLKLSQENEKLNAELKAMTERIEAAERRRKELEEKAKSGNTSS